MKDDLQKFFDEEESEDSSDDPFADPSGELPASLLKATGDDFSYVLGTRDGRIIHFAYAQIQEGRKWVRVSGHIHWRTHPTTGEDYQDDYDPIEMSGVDHGFPRGLDIRISDIVWCADAPDGS